MDHSSALPSFVNDWKTSLSHVQNTWKQVRANRAQSSGTTAQYSRLEEKIDQPSEPHTSQPSLIFRGVRGLLHLVVRILSLLWFLLPRRGRPVRQKAPHELHALAYLDALRGYFSLVIFTGHFMLKDWRWLNPTLLKLPWFQFPFRGGFASLDMFFWISGYAVTYRLLGFVHTHQWKKLLDALASTAFRRHPRLFLPVLPVTAFTYFAAATGIAIPPAKRANVVQGNWIWGWIKDTAHLINPFTGWAGWYDGSSGSKLVDPLWSLPAEYRSSMICLLFVLGTCKMLPKTRQLLILLLIPVFFCWECQWAAMAFLGMWFADRRQQKVQEDKARNSLVTTQPQQAEVSSAAVSTPSKASILDGPVNEKSNSTLPWNSPRVQQNLSRFREPILYILFLWSFQVMKDPHTMSQKTGFPNNFLTFITPNHMHDQIKTHIHLCLGAFMMLFPIDQLPLLQKPLRTSFSQFLGELSFGIYAVHFTVKWIFWEPRYVVWMAEKYGQDKFDTFAILFPGYVCMVICVLWAADLFRRIDMQVVVFCKWLESQVFKID